jgi:TPR repeat protein
MMRFPIVPSAVGFLIIGLASTQSVNAACERTSAPVIDTDSATASLFDPPNPRSRDTQHETLNRSLVSPFAQNSYFQNRLGVMFARGNGVAKNERLASQLFRRLALDGYTPAMVNLGTMYELGSAGRQDHRRAYAWIRAALALGVPKADYDSTLYKLGMIAARLGSARTTRAESLAVGIADSIMRRCQRSEDRYADSMALGPVP